MDIHDLRYLYDVLCRQLDAAYAERPWDGERIEQIARDMLPLEEALAACGVVIARADPGAGDARQADAADPRAGEARAVDDPRPRAA